MADLGDARVGDGHILGVDQVDRNAVRGIAVKAGGGVDIQRRADNQHDVSGGNDVDGLVDVRDGLPEENDMRTQLAAVRSIIPQMNLIVTDVNHLFF